MNDLKRFDMNGTPHVSGQYCNAQEAADLIESQQQRIAELEQREAELGQKIKKIRIQAIDAGKQVKMGRECSKELEWERAHYLIHTEDTIKKIISLTATAPNDPFGYQQTAMSESSAPTTILNALRREVFIEGFNAGFTDCWIVDEETHADEAVEMANQRYPDKE